MRHNSTNLLIVLAILVFITACVCRSDRNDNESPSPSGVSANSEDAPKPAKSVSDDQKNKKKDEGDFLVEHIDVKNPRFVEIDRQVKEEKLMEKAADRLNAALILPHNITLRTKDCDQVNAFYDANDESVTVCYELMEHFF